MKAFIYFAASFWMCIKKTKRSVKKNPDNSNCKQSLKSSQSVRSPSSAHAAGISESRDSPPLPEVDYDVLGFSVVELVLYNQKDQDDGIASSKTVTKSCGELKTINYEDLEVKEVSAHSGDDDDKIELIGIFDYEDKFYVDQIEALRACLGAARTRIPDENQRPTIPGNKPPIKKPKPNLGTAQQPTTPTSKPNENVQKKTKETDHSDTDTSLSQTGSRKATTTPTESEKK